MDTKLFESTPLERALAAQAKHWPLPVIHLVDAGESDWMRAADFFEDSAAIEAMLAYQQSFTPDLDLKGQAAYAIGDYSYMFAITSVVPLVGFGLLPDLSPSNYALRFTTKPVEHRGRWLEDRHTHIRFMDSGIVTDKERLSAHPDTRALLDRQTLLQRFRSEVEDHFAPLVGILAKKSGLSRNALWRLVCDSLSQLFIDAGRRFGCLEDAKAMAMAVLKHERSPLANRQMHYFDIELWDDGNPPQLLTCATFRARGGCCRFYTVEGGHLCSTCVLQNPQERDARIETKLRQRFGLSSRAS